LSQAIKGKGNKTRQSRKETMHWRLNEPGNLRWCKSAKTGPYAKGGGRFSNETTRGKGGRGHENGKGNSGI